MKTNPNIFISETQRQHLNLSPRAMHILESDMIRFNNDYEMKNRSGFMNTIIKNYYDRFPLSKQVVLKEVMAIKKTIQSNNFSDKLTNSFIDMFTEEVMINEISEYIKDIQYGAMFKLKLDNDTTQLLSTIDEIKYFNKHAPRSGLGIFIKAVLETYSELPKEQREKVFFRAEYERIEKAIDNDEVIVLIKHDHLRIRPIKITLEPNSQHHVVRYLMNINEETRSYSLDSLTIKDFSASLARYEIGEKSPFWQELKKHEHFHDHVFLGQLPKEDITVRFTESGLERFLREEDQINLIGVPNLNDKYTYTFKSTEPEMFYEMFKFGPQAVILKPEYIKKHFQLLYRAADKHYDS
jgi:hypothetical protein